jgi:hypothetical protein
VVFPNVHPPPMATQLQNLGGVSAIVVGAPFCEHNDQVHGLVPCEPPRQRAAKAGPGSRDGDSPRQQIRGGFREAPHPAADGGGGMA